MPNALSTLTKDKLVALVATRTELTQTDVHAVIQSTLEVIQQALVEGYKVELRNFGIFRTVIRKGRKGCNPQDRTKTFEIPERCVAKFKMGAHLEVALNASMKSVPPMEPEAAAPVAPAPA